MISNMRDQPTRASLSLSGSHLKFSKEVPNVWKIILFLTAGLI
jgi:hypothetical protein